MSAAKTEIKPIIESICLLLGLYGFTKLPANTFRRGKFNENDSVKPCWLLLAEICIVRECNWHVDRSRLNDKISKFQEADVLVTYVKQVFLGLGYKANAFYNLPYDQSHGSRELLIAFAWLLNHLSLFDELIKNAVRSSVAKHQTPEDWRKNSATALPDKLTSQSQLKSIEGDSQQLVWLMGKARLSSRRVHHLHEEKLTLMSKFFSLYTPEPAHNDFTPLQEYLLKTPELMEHYLTDLKLETTLFNEYVKWKENEGLFWKWMTTVLELREKDQVEEIDHSRLLAWCRQDSLYKFLTLTKAMDMSNSRSDTMNTPIPDVKFIPVTSNKSFSHAIPLSEVCEKLKITIRQLKDELSTKQESSKKLLLDWSTKFPDVVCIEPLKRISFAEFKD